VASGASTIRFVGDPEASSDVAERFEGLVAGAARHGADVSLLHVPDFSEQAGFGVARAVSGSALPDAFACANDELALGLVLGLREAAVRVPEDTMVAGWDDVMAARYAGLTTVRQPMRELGIRAARLLDQLINRTRQEPVHEVLATELIVRQSTQPATQSGTTPSGGTTA
jgi:LacI family transcriptional regulator